MSESNYDDRQRGRISELMKSMVVRGLFDAGVVGGKRAASYLRQLGMPEEKIAYRYDVIDNNYFAAGASESISQSMTASGLPHFLFVGRLAPEKNLPLLLKAHEEYLRAGNTWPLVIVGSGPLEATLREQAHEQIRNSTVIFAGHKSVHELPAFYARAECLVLPSTSEPWGLVVNEAMASGLPVIVSSKCGCADDLVIDGTNGLLVNPLDISDLSSKLEQMSNISRRDRLAMGEKSREIISEYSPEKWAEEVTRLVSAIGEDNAALRLA
jgi:glycosyltransferase involved in cell wall biosynthesis